MKQTYQTGLSGENAAEEYLKTQCGMICLERRFRTKCGEIDLIMAERETIVFVEVKTRLSGKPGIGLSAVDTRKQKRILDAALLYLMKRRWLNRSIRFDVIEITGNEIMHIPNAFQPYGRFYH